MADMNELAAACDAVVARMTAAHDKPVACPVCGAAQPSQDGLLVHLFESHGVRTVDFADVTDLDGFLSTLKVRLFPSDGTVHCPVCGENVLPADPAGQNPNAAVLSSLGTHLAQTSHTLWNDVTIPALAHFLVPVLDKTDNAVQTDLAEADNDQEGWEAVDDLDEGWEEPMQCLYCSDVSSACLDHMKQTHDFDLPAATRQHAGVKDEYDVIRLINAVRADWGRGKCPGCDFEGTEAAREAHLRENANHRLPASVPADDALLRPVLPGDSLLSLVVTSGEGFLPSEEADPDFPMVPTVQERAAAQRS